MSDDGRCERAIREALILQVDREALVAQLMWIVERERIADEGVRLIATERWHQTVERGFDAKHDDNYTKGELAEAALVFVECALGRRDPVVPFGLVDESMSCKPRGLKDPLHDIVKAGGLLAAEAARLAREPA